MLRLMPKSSACEVSAIRSTLKLSVGRTALRRLHRRQQSFHQVSCRRVILNNFPSGKNGDQILVREDHQALASESESHPHKFFAHWIQPPFESVLKSFAALARINIRSERFLRSEEHTSELH